MLTWNSSCNEKISNLEHCLEAPHCHYVGFWIFPAWKTWKNIDIWLLYALTIRDHQLRNISFALRLSFCILICYLAKGDFQFVPEDLSLFALGSGLSVLILLYSLPCRLDLFQLPSEPAGFHPLWILVWCLGMLRPFSEAIFLAKNFTQKPRSKVVIRKSV